MTPESTTATEENLSAAKPDHATHVGANRDYFDAEVHRYDARPEIQRVARHVGELILREYPDFDEESTVLMDFACGSGLISQALAPYCKKIVGVDISPGTVEYYNTRVQNQGISPEEMKAVCVDLKGEEGELEGINFDIVVCCQAYHHMASIENTTRILASFLKPGGTLVVVDLIRNEKTLRFHEESVAAINEEADTADKEHPHGQENQVHDHTAAHGHLHPRTRPHFHDHIVPHKGGFVEEEIRLAFSGAGLRDYEWKAAVKIRPSSGERSPELFMAKARR